jgi:arylsulfatase A-like enzyme
VPPPPPNAKLRPVILVAVESLRPDVIGLVHEGSLVMPRVTALAETGRVFRRTWATSTQSNYSDPSIPSSLYPLRTREYFRYSASDPWPRTLLWDVLKPAGYATAVISSQNESWGGMHAFLTTPALDLFYDPERSNAPSHVSRRDLAMIQAVESHELNAGSFHDEHTVGVAIDWIHRQRDRPFVLAMNMQTSHFPYSLPESWRPPYEPAVLDESVRFLAQPAEKLPLVRIAYWNALRYVDEQIGKLLDALAADGRLDDAVIVIYGENGESFGEGGRALHAAEPVEAALRVALVIHAPGIVPPGADDYPTTLVDVVPTVLGRMGFARHPGFQGVDVLSADKPPADERLLFAHVNTPLAQADAVVQGGRWKFTYDARKLAEHLADVTADPREQRNLVDAEPAVARRLRDALDAWRDRQLAYYAFPFYYRTYWPPAAPSLPAGSSNR